MDKALSALGMAKKAGLLAVGGEDTLDAIRRRKAKLVITASDTSEASISRAQSSAKSGRVEYMSVPYTQFELGTTAGRGSPGIIAFLDKGLAEAFKKKLASNHTNTDNTKESDA